MSTQLALLPNGFFENAEYFIFPHPRNGKNATFILKDNMFYELMKIDRPHSSWLVGNSFVPNGAPLISIPIHPLLIVIPFISSRGKQMLPEEDFFFNTPFACISNKLIPYLKYICQSSEIGDNVNYYYDQEKTLNWLAMKTEKLMPFLKQKNDLSDQLLIEVAFDVIRHYISNDLSNLLKDILHDKYPGSFPPKTINSTDDSQIFPSQKPPEKPKKKGPSSKLKKPEGNMSISSFFAPAKSKK